MYAGFVNKTQSLATYKQIVQMIEQAIDSKRLIHMEPLPTEQVLCELYNISPIVAKQAYKTLQENGKVIRIKGKGTFVNRRQRYQTALDQLHRFLAKTSIGGKVRRRRHILLERRPIDTRTQAVCQLTEDAMCFVLKRVVDINRNPYVYQEIIVPERHFPRFPHALVEYKSIIDLFEQRFDHVIESYESTLFPTNVSLAEALLLDIEPNNAAFVFETLFLVKNHRVIARMRSVLPAAYTVIEEGRYV